LRKQGIFGCPPDPYDTSPPTNLPQTVSNFISRDAELGEILALSDTQRLVTLAGAGGIGKTRLGFEAARQQLPKFAVLALASRR
jgi:hypothetical protein